MADVDLKFSKPEARIRINRDKASVMGVSTKNIAQTLQYGLSGQRMGYFYMNGKQYEILGEINRQQRNKPADLKAIYIRSSNGDMIQLDNLIELETVSPLPNCTVTTDLYQPQFPPDWLTERPSDKDWMKWIRLPRKHWTILSVPHYPETPRNTVKVLRA